MFERPGRYIVIFFLMLFAFIIININPMVAYIFIGLAAFIMFFFRSRESIILYSTYFAFEDTLLLHTPDNLILLLKYLGDILVLAAFLATFAKLAIRRHTLNALEGNYLHIPLILFLLCGFISALTNGIPAFLAFVVIRQVLRFIVIYYAIVFAAQSEWTQKDMRTLIKIIVALVLIQAGLGFLQALLGPESPLIQSIFLLTPSGIQLEDYPVITQRPIVVPGRPTIIGTLLVSNTIGIFLVFGFCLLLGLYSIPANRANRLKLLTAIGFLSAAILLTYSRQSFYAGLLGTITIALIQKKAKLIIASLLVMTGFTFYFFQIKGLKDWDPQKITLPQHIVSPFHPAYLERFKGRDRLLAATEIVPMFLKTKYALLGLGPGSIGSSFGSIYGYSEAYGKLGIPSSQIDYINLAVADFGFGAILMQFGIIGFAAFYAMPFFLFRYIRRRTLPYLRDPLWQGLTIGFLGYIVALVVSNVGFVNFGIRQIAFYFWTVAGVVQSYSLSQPDEASSHGA